MHGDWDDVVASLYVATRGQELGVLSERAGDSVVEFELLTVRDEPARFLARREPGQSAGSESITITAWVGTFGDADRENLLLDRFTRRLNDLAGVDYRPVR